MTERRVLDMKFRWEKKYLYWGVTALLVVIGGLLAY